MGFLLRGFNKICLVGVVLFGFMPRAGACHIGVSEADMCQARWVFTGLAVGSEAYAFEWPPVMTAVTLSVDMVVHGDPPSTVVIRFVGGTLNGLTVSPETRMVVGQRYLVVASPIMQPEVGSVLPRDGTVLVDWWSIGDKTEISYASLMQAVWKEHCDPTVDPNLKPTRQFLNILSRNFLEWCQHY